jgi:Ca2+-binding RTX toxin-like protein
VLSVVGRGLGGGESLTAAGGPGFVGPFIRPVSFEGGAGRDLLVGGSAPDLLDGGPGGDRIRARDGKRDTITCGGGRDRVRADRKDKLTGC